MELLEAAAADARANDAPRSTPGVAIALLTLAIAAACASRTVFSPVQELAKADLVLSDIQMSLVQGLATSIPIAIFSIPLGRAVDRGNRSRLLIAMALIWTLGTGLTVLATGFWSLFMARMLAGLGSLCALPIVISMTADLSSAARRGRTLLFPSVGNLGGAALAFAAGGWLLGATAHLFQPLAGWRRVHLVFGAASLLVVLALALLREPIRQETDELAARSFRTELEGIWSRRGFLMPLFLGQVTVVMADTAASIWAAPVLSRDFHQEPAQFAGWLGLIILLAGLVGSIIGGVAADAGQRSRMPGGLLGGAVIAAACSIPASLFAVMPSVLGFALMLALLLTCGAIMGLITTTALAVMLPNELRGLCCGAFIVVGAIIGFGVAPTLVAGVSRLFGGESHLGAALAFTSIVTGVVTVIGFAAAMRAAARLHRP